MTDTTNPTPATTAPTPTAAPANQPDPVERALTACKEYARKTNDITLRFFIQNYLDPTLRTMREEYQALAVEAADLGDDGDDELLGQAADLIQELSLLLDASFRAAGWMDATEVTPKMPAEIRRGYEEAREHILQFVSETEGLWDDLDGEDEGEEEGEDEGEEGDGETVVPASPGGVA